MRHNKMCQNRLRPQISCLFLLFGFILTVPASAEDLSDAQKGLSDGYNQYYEKIRKSPEPLSPQQKEALRKETVAPAQKKFRETLRRERREGTVREVVKQDMSRRRKLVTRGKKAKTGKKDGKPAASRPSEPAAVQPREPDVVIDGTAIPREIEFSGPQKKPDAPKK